MNSFSILAIVYTVITLIVVIFQICLFFGAPWGQMTMGGKYSGKLPIKFRIFALIQSLLLLFVCLSIIEKVRLTDFLSDFVTDKTVWLAVIIGFVSMVLNTITPSKAERRLWAPVAIIMFASSLIIAVWGY